MYRVEEQDMGLPNWHGWLVTVTQDESVMNDSLDLYICILIDRFKHFCYENDNLNFDHVEFITKQPKANVNTIGIKWHVRTPKPNPST